MRELDELRAETATPPADAGTQVPQPLGPPTFVQVLSNRDVRRALFVWWATLAVGSWVVGTPFSFVWEVLRDVPDLGWARDLELLYEQLYASTSSTGPLRPLVRNAILLTLLVRAVAIVPTALTAAAVLLSHRRSLGPAPSPTGEKYRHTFERWLSGRLTALAWSALGRFLLLTALVQLVSVGLAGLCLGLAASCFTSPFMTVLEWTLGGLSLAAAAGTYLVGFAFADVSRLSLFRRDGASVWPCVLDGLEALTDRPRSTLGISARTCLLTVVVSTLTQGLSAGVAVVSPEIWGAAMSWAAAQIGTSSLLLLRVWGWNDLVARLPSRAALSMDDG